MDEYMPLLKKIGLFRGIETLKPALECLGTRIKTVSKGEIILLAGDTPTHVGIVLAGRLHIFREDKDGNRSLLTAVTPGGLFAEALCCAGVEYSPVTVAADTDSAIMLISFKRILHTCANACPHHIKLIENMLGEIAKKNLLLQSRMEIVSLKSVRQKVLLFLESFLRASARGQDAKGPLGNNDAYFPRAADMPHSDNTAFGREVTIPFNREKMAEYLCVERSALSHVHEAGRLDRLQKEPFFAEIRSNLHEL